MTVRSTAALARFPTDHSVPMTVRAALTGGRILEGLATIRALERLTG
jgi:hypothetical protein